MLRQRRLKDDIGQILRIYEPIKPAIETRLNEFSMIWERKDESEIFRELVFCLLTPQSKAKECWNAVESLDRKKLLQNGDADEIASELKKVRFRFSKAKYIIEARERFLCDGKSSIAQTLADFESVIEAREWLVSNVKGFGYKEASHFLRNIGLGDDIAILDRHILRTLLRFGAIEQIPSCLNRKKYFEIEKKLLRFAQNVYIPASHLDLLFWYMQTGYIFK